VIAARAHERAVPRRGPEIHFGLLSLGEHAARLLLLLDMVLDHLGEYGHFGVEVIIFGWVPL
jgi:hypothetical protein